MSPSFAKKFSPSHRCPLYRRESTPSSDIQGESGELDSTRRPASEINSRRRSVNKKMPSSAEIDEFFSAAEKDLQRQHAEKYLSFRHLKFNQFVFKKNIKKEKRKK